MNSPTPTLVQALADQDRAFASAFAVLEKAILSRAFPAASIAVTHRDQLIALKAFGRFTYEAPVDHGEARTRSSPGILREDGDLDVDVTPATIFDMASVTKAVATTTMAMILYERGILELDAPVIGVIPEFLSAATERPDSRRRGVTFRMLLAHSSGLPAYDKLFLQAPSRDALLRAVFAIPLSADPGSHAEYSDIGFILLGAALDRLAGESLDVFCQREIFGPLAMSNTTFNPPKESREKIPPTADEREQPCATVTAGQGPAALGPSTACSGAPRSTFRRRMIQGEVQDENAYILGGVAGHAGLFSTAEDMARFASAMLQGGHPILRPETVSFFTRREASPPGTSRALGWDTPSAPSQSGKYFGPRSFGHLGYTGTSLWIDPDRQLSIILLTNRTWPDCSNQAIKQIRPKFHDAVIEALTI